MRQNAAAPSLVRKHPEIFWRTLTILRSLSAWLLSNGTPKSRMNLSTASRCLSKRSSRFLPLVCLGRPLLPGRSGGGFASSPASRCVLSGSCPQLLDPPLRTTHHPVDVKSVGVSRYLGRYPARQSNNGRRQRLTQAENSLQARKGDLYLLPYSGSLATGFAGHQHDPQLGQFLLQVLAAVGEIRQEPPRYLLAQPRLLQKLLGQANLRDVGRGELVGDGNTVRGAKQVQLDPINAEGAPPHPGSPIESRRLGDLARVEDLKQGGIHDHGLRISHQFGHDGAPQGFEESPEPAHAAVER